jgi:hypothetical protein
MKATRTVVYLEPKYMQSRLGQALVLRRGRLIEARYYVHQLVRLRLSKLSDSALLRLFLTTAMVIPRHLRFY